MQYDLSGIVYRLWAVAGVLFFFGLLFLTISRFWNRAKIDGNRIVVGLCFIVIALAVGGKYMIAAAEPKIETYEGYFCESYRDSRVAPPLPFTNCYVFTNKTKPNPGFYLDTFSKRKIWPQGFRDNVLYRIHYESTSKIIVKVEIIRT